MERLERDGLEIATYSRIEKDSNGLWTVPSQSKVGRVYRVFYDGKECSCTCKDFAQRDDVCKHIYAVRFFINGQVLSEDQEEEKRKRPNYPQDWPKYHAARRDEYPKFRILLADLVKDLENFKMGDGGGRPRVLAPDLLFAMALKVYLGFPAGRLHGALVDAQETGFIKDVPSRNTILSHFGERFMTGVLTELIEATALPMRSIETHFAADASGFTTSRFVRWLDQKYGQVAKEHVWAKAHIMVGVKTHIITAVKVLGSGSSESKVFPELLDRTARRFFLLKLSADGAYSTKAIVESIASEGAEPLIPFDSNATGAGGGIWEKAFHFFQYHREEFLRHYHQRSNVEAAFWMTKSKFWDSVRSRKPVQVRNEVLMKFLCHNICCVIQAMYELGIEPTFWGEKKAA
jgi:transposase